MAIYTQKDREDRDHLCSQLKQKTYVFVFQKNMRIGIREYVCHVVVIMSYSICLITKTQKYHLLSDAKIYVYLYLDLETKLLILNGGQS